MNIFLLGHILADFVYQKDSDVVAKIDSTVKGNLKHILKVFIFYVIAATFFIIAFEIVDSSQIILVFSFICLNIVLHFLFDIIKTRLQNEWDNKNLFLITIDQFLHVMVLLISFNLILGDYVSIEYIGNKYVVLMIFLLIATFVSSVIIREILNLLNLDYRIEVPDKNSTTRSKDSIQDDKDNGMKIGKWIGIIERTIMFLAIFFDILGLLTIVVAFKTLTRYENIKKNPEYYIIGNLLSILAVLVNYGIYKQLV